MEPNQRQTEMRRLVEEVGMATERSGLPRMVGRILGWLLICDPPHQSAADLARALQASKGSISTSMHLLLQLGFVEHFALPGERRTYYVIKPGAWLRLIRNGSRELTVIRQLTERGLALLEGQPPELRRRLEEAHSLYSFLECEYPLLIDRWEREQQRELNRE